MAIFLSERVKLKHNIGRICFYSTTRDFRVLY